MDLYHLICEKHASLTPKQQEIAGYLLAHPEDACYISLRTLSRSIGASEVSILRTCNALGFSGFLELKEAFRGYTPVYGRGLPLPGIMGPGTAGQTEENLEVLGSIALEEQEKLNQFLQTLSQDQLFEEARRLLSANEVFLFGHDVSKIFADYYYHRLTFLRIKASSVMIGDGSTNQSMLARMKEGDHVVLFSFPPYHLPVYNTARIARQQGASITVITDSLASPAVLPESNTFICNTGTRFFYNSHTLLMALINLVASCVAMEMGEQYNTILQEERAVEGFMRAEDTENPQAINGGERV